jgi:hypothetical protein
MKEGRGTYHEHERVSARMTRPILERLCFSNEVINNAAALIRQHMFGYDPGTKISAVRRKLQILTPRQIYELTELRRADRCAGKDSKPGIDSQSFRMLTHMLQVLKDKSAPNINNLPINGHDIMELTGLVGQPVGTIKRAVHSVILEHPEYNDRQTLLNLIATKHTELLEGQDVTNFLEEKTAQHNAGG